MIPIKINVEFYTSKNKPVDKSTMLKYPYPLNTGIILNDNGMMLYTDKDKIVKHFEKLNEDCFCYLDNNITIIFFSSSDKQYEKFIRQVKIYNIIQNI
jgi:hypothetical protein